MNTYNVPQRTGIETIAPAKSLTLSAIYGIGVNLAVARQKAEAQNQTDFDVTSGINSFTPDAVEDGSGGFQATDRWDGYMSSSLIGMPVMCYLKFVGGTYIDLQGNQQVIPDVTFETVVMTLNLRKNMKVTDISGRDTGSVKEFIGLGDWSIEIRAIITADAPVNDNVEKRNQDGVYPRDNMAEIWKVLKAPIAIPIDCWYLNQFDINYVVIDTDNTVIQQIEGEYTMQRLIISALSDNPLVIKIAQ